MTEQEILSIQEQNGQQEFYLLLADSMLHAFGHGALALAEITGCHIRHRHIDQLGKVPTAGLPAIHLDSLRVKMFLAGSFLERHDENSWRFLSPYCLEQ